VSDYVSNIVGCIQVVQEQIPIALVYYSHVPVIVMSLVVGVYVLAYSRKNTLSLLFFLTTFLFALWALNDFVVWTLLYNAPLTMFAWASLELVEVTLFYVSLNLVYYFLRERHIPPLVNSALIVPVVVTFVFTVLGAHLLNYDIQVCEATERTAITEVMSTGFDILYFVLIIGLFLREVYRRRENLIQRTLFVGGVVSMLLFFLVFSFLADYMENYNWELFAMAGMPVFLGVIGFSMVRYQLFNVKVVGAQILVFASVFTVASQFLFVKTTINRYLTGVTLVMLLVGGVFLIRSVRRIEEQRRELAEANAGQERFIHFLSHEVKGYLTVARHGFASVVEGDYGPLPSELTDVARKALARLNDGVATVENILKTANLKSGKVTYTFAPFDMAEAVRTLMEKLRPRAEERGLALTLEVPEEPCMVVGDAGHLVEHVLENLIENAVNYTPSGSVHVALARAKDTVRFSVRDTGVGLSLADRAVLFTEGGRGANASKVNVHSTGHGLFIAYTIVRAHRGRIWAESEGEGKGATFLVELPIAQASGKK